jgi:hypothetical protein
MKNEDIKRRIKKLEAKLPLANPDGEAILQLLKQAEDEGFWDRPYQPLSEAGLADLKEFLDNYPFKPKRSGGVEIEQARS